MSGLHDAFGVPPEDNSNQEYLEKVRFHFADRPELFNAFIDIMQHYRTGTYVFPPSLLLHSL